MTHAAYDPADILTENQALRARLEEVEATLRAIRNGPQGDSVLGQEDISGRKQAEDKLRRSEQLHRIAFDLAPTGLVYCALDGRYINVNARMCEITGYTAAELLGMTIWDLTHPDDLVRENELFPALLSGGTPDYANEKRYVRKDGSSRWVAVKARLVADDTGQPLHTVSVIRDIQDRKRTEAALRLSEIRYRRLFEAAHDGILILDPDTRKIVDANPFMTTLTGYPHEQLIGLELYQIGFLADAQESWDLFEKLKATRHVRYENLPLQTEQGGIRDVEVVANLYDEGGHSVVQCTVRDITGRKRAELALRESEGRNAFLLKLSDTLGPLRDPFEVQTATMRLVVEHLDVIRASYFKLGPDQDRFSLTAGYERGALPIPDHMRLSDFAPDMADQYRKGQIFVLEDAEKEVPAGLEQAAYRSIGVRAAVGVPLVKDGLLLGVFGVHSATPRHWTVAEVQLLKDIADRVWAAVERKQAEAALQASEHRYRTLIEGTSAVSWSCAPSGLQVEPQPLWMAFTGQSAAEMLGMGYATAFHPDDAENAAARWVDAVSRAEPYSSEHRIRRHDGEWRWMRVSSVPVHQNGGIAEWFGMAVDITERKRQEEHIRLLMGEVNHRSKNMLTIVQAIAKRTMTTQPENFMERFGQRVQALVANQDLLVKNEWKAVSLGDLIGSQLAHFRDARDIRVALDGPPVMITASASQALGMALHELATNAAKYGALSIKSGRVIISWSLLSDAAGKARFTLSWIESGGPLVAKPTRLGFGSTVIGSMIKMSLGCDAKIDFAPTGLIWRIDCLAAGLIEGSALSAPQSNGAAVKEEPAQDSGRHRVLVVEDEPLIAMDIAHTLSEAGYDVIGPANSVAQALALIAQSGCDAAVLDTNLGAETAEPVARELIRRGLPFITSSGYALEQQPEIMRTVPLLSKPLQPDVLIAEIVRCLGR